MSIPALVSQSSLNSMMYQNNRIYDEKIEKLSDEIKSVINFGRNLVEFRNDLEIFNKKIQDVAQSVRKNTEENLTLKEEIRHLKLENEKLNSKILTKEDILKIFEELQESKMKKDPVEDDPFGIYSK